MSASGDATSGEVPKRFPPKPENDFAEYIRTYYRECRSRVPEIEAIAGKWMFRDLIPGMSDFDTRFIVADTMNPESWCRMSKAVGEVHLELCRRYPSWARNLEHLPGVNLTWSELESETYYYPEYTQWSYYDTTQPELLSTTLARLFRRTWDLKDEYFHLKKFCLYYGRYDRAIDPPINLGVHRAKYPLHSRVMHYFNPPVMSALCLLERRTLCGKFEAFELAAGRFPSLRAWDLVEEVLEAGYADRRFYREEYLSAMEDRFEEALEEIARSLAGSGCSSIIDSTGSDEVAAWRRALGEVPVDPSLLIFDNCKFSRLMKGRLEFYAAAPDRFDTTWLIRNELGRIGKSFFEIPFSLYLRMIGEPVPERIEEIPDRLCGRPLSQDEADAVRRFIALTREMPEPGGERERARGIAAVFDGFYLALDAITREAGKI